MNPILTSELEQRALDTGASEIIRLKCALERLASLSAFDAPKSIDPIRDSELVMRIEFARKVLSLLPLSVK